MADKMAANRLQSYYDKHSTLSVSPVAWLTFSLRSCRETHLSFEKRGEKLIYYQSTRYIGEQGLGVMLGVGVGIL